MCSKIPDTFDQLSWESKEDYEERKAFLED